MKAYHYYLADIIRTLRFPAFLAECGYYPDATGGGRGRRGQTLEFGMRLQSGQNLAVDIVKGKEYREKLPHLIIKTPGMEHFSNVTDPREIFFLIYPASVVPFLRETGLTTEFAYLKLPKPERVLSYAAQIEELGANLYEKGVADRIDLLAFQLLCEIFLTDVSVDKGGFYDDKIQAIASQLRMHFRERIQLDLLLRREGLSRRTFFRYWSKHFSLSPKAYLEELRFQEARRLLTQTNLPIAEIAEQLQAPSLSYFCEHIRKRFRKTPLQIRRRHSGFG